MTTARIPVLATSFATCMVLMVAFLACVLLWAISYHPALHLILPHVLVGFPAITVTGILVGLSAAWSLETFWARPSLSHSMPGTFLPGGSGLVRPKPSEPF